MIDGQVEMSLLGFCHYNELAKVVFNGMARYEHPLSARHGECGIKETWCLQVSLSISFAIHSGSMTRESKFSGKVVISSSLSKRSYISWGFGSKLFRNYF